MSTDKSGRRRVQPMVLEEQAWAHTFSALGDAAGATGSNSVPPTPPALTPRAAAHARSPGRVCCVGCTSHRCYSLAIIVHPPRIRIVETCLSLPAHLPGAYRCVSVRVLCCVFVRRFNTHASTRAGGVRTRCSCHRRILTLHQSLFHSSPTGAPLAV